MKEGSVVGVVAPPQEGYLAFYAEMDFELDGLPFTLCTQIRVAEAKKE